MQLVENYLEAIRFFVPRRRQADALREVSGDVLAAIAQRSRTVGRPLTEDEQADVLRDYGHPVAVAARYRDRSRLMGPLLPVYLLALKTGIAVALIVSVALAVVAGIRAGVGRELADTLLGFPDRVLMVFIWTTVGFAAVEVARRRLMLSHRWDPRTLPALFRPEPAPSRRRAMATAVLAAAGMVWLLALPWSLPLLLGGAAAHVVPGPIWRLAYVPIVLLAAAGCFVSFAAVRRPGWTRPRAFATLAVHAGGIAIAGLLLAAGPFFLPSDGENPAIAALVNAGVRIGIIAWVGTALIEIVREVFRLSRE